MNTDQLTKLLTVVVSLLQAISWPLIVLFILIYLGASLKKFIAKMCEFTFKAGTSGVEATAKIQQSEAAASLGVATVLAQKQDEAQGNKQVSTLVDVQEIAKLIVTIQEY